MDETLLFFRERVDEKTAEDVRFLKEALGLRAEAKEAKLVFGSLRRREDEIALLTRSIMEILVELATGVEVPEQDVVEGRVRPGLSPELRGRPGTGPTVKIHSGTAPPRDAYVAVRYRNYWFWVDDRDLGSKRIFTFLRMFSSIAETGVAPQVPILTIPAN